MKSHPWLISTVNARRNITSAFSSQLDVVEALRRCAVRYSAHRFTTQLAGLRSSSLRRDTSIGSAGAAAAGAAPWAEAECVVATSARHGARSTGAAPSGSVQFSRILLFWTFTAIRWSRRRQFATRSADFTAISCALLLCDKNRCHVLL